LVGDNRCCITSDIDRYGPLVVFISVLLAERGLPLPGFPILVMAGAFMTKGRHQVIDLVSAGVGGCRRRISDCGDWKNVYLDVVKIIEAVPEKD